MNKDSSEYTGRFTGTIQEFRRAMIDAGPRDVVVRAP
jgi:hypothetical protein